MEELEKILNLKGEISQIGLSTRSRKAKVEEAFEEDYEPIHHQDSAEFIDETSRIAKQIKEATRAS